MFRILITDPVNDAGLAKLAQSPHATYDLKTDLSSDDLLAIIPHYDALIIRGSTKIMAEHLAEAKRLVAIGRAGIGVDNIDIDAATMRGVVVMNAPEANSIAVAEQTMAHMLAVSRHTVQAHASLQAGRWNRADFFGHQLYQKTLGIIGFGRVGRLVACRARAFEMNILVDDPYVSEEVGREHGVTLVDLDDLLPQADYIALHVPLTGETEQIINAQTISQMKKGVIIINTGRGQLIDDQDLRQALDSGQVRAAALDVFSEEPPASDHPLLSHAKVIHTPRLGSRTYEAKEAVAEQIIEQVLDVLRGHDFRNAVNMPFQLGAEFTAVRPYMALADKIGRLQTGLAPTPITKLELTVSGEAVEKLVKPIAAALLTGILQNEGERVNYTNAPVLAHERGIDIAQTTGLPAIHYYPNLLTCRALWEGGERTISGVLFGGSEPRIVQVDDYQLEAKPEGFVLVLQNEDVPGVIGQVGTILAAYSVNIGEWRMGRNAPGSAALSFINLDSEPEGVVIDAMERITAVTQAELVALG
ncbi:MAG: phosphoglycerate dehydrogenase [Chloroflexota bacterium]